jgi:predicted signal transduction protein with EAL and GGDEF domain
VAQRIVVAMRPSFTIEGRAMHVGASVGIACAADDSVDELLRNADLAMYRAKSCGKGRHAVFVPEMHAALLRRVELEEELRDAVERGDLALVYQPIVELADQRVVGFEALVRWTHPRLGPVPPSVFIPVAEEAGTIPALGRWVLATACREAASWPEGEGGVRAPGLSVNVSGHQLEEAGFVDVVRAVLAETGLAAARLTLEITESVLMRDSEAMLGRLHELKALGVRLAIDDFGTGYSSLSYLHRFPVDVLKIDKTFVDAVAAGRDDPVLARAIIALGGMLHLSTVAEGIEHREQQLGVERMGCTYGQGYYFSRPIDPSAVRALLADGKAGRVGPVSLTAGA